MGVSINILMKNVAWEGNSVKGVIALCGRLAKFHKKSCNYVVCSFRSLDVGLLHFMKLYNSTCCMPLLQLFASVLSCA